MSIAFLKDGRNYELAMDGTVKADGTAYGTWATDDDNALAVTAARDGAVFRQPARWATKANRLAVTPDGGAAVEFLDATEGSIQFRIEHNRLLVDPLPDTDDFSFMLSGDWALSDDGSALLLKAATGDLAFAGGLNDSQSRFAWAFDAENDEIRKRFFLRFDGQWKLKKRDQGTGLLAVFSFEYTNKGETSRDTFELPVEVTADAANGNRLLFSYKRAGSATTWSVAFAGRFATKGGSIVGYSAELYDESGRISSRFTFDFKGRIKDGSAATRNSMRFVLTVAGQAVELSLSGNFSFAKSSLTFSLQLNTASKTGLASTISFGVKLATARGTTVDLAVKVDGSTVTVSLKVGADIALGGSRKGSVYGFLDMTSGGGTVGVDALFGITLN